MDPVQQHRILSEKEISYIAAKFDGLLLQGSISNSNHYLVISLLNSHGSLFAANAELSFKNMELKGTLPPSSKLSPVIVFTRLKSGQCGYETFLGELEASIRLEYLSMYYSEGEDVAVEIGMAEVKKVEKHNWNE